MHEGGGDNGGGHKRPQTPPEPHPGEYNNHSHHHSHGRSPPEQQTHVPAVPNSIGGPRTPPGPPIGGGPRTPPSPMDRLDDSPRGGRGKRDYRYAVFVYIIRKAYFSHTIFDFSRDHGSSVSPPPSKRSRRGGSRDRSRSRDRERSRGMGSSRRSSRDRYRSPRYSFLIMTTSCVNPKFLRHSL